MSETTTAPEGATGTGTIGSPWFKEIEVQLTGNDGNAYVIMGAVSSALRRHGVSEEDRNKYSEESMSGNYDTLLQTAMKWVSVA
jgi:hypothetical protein